MVTILRNGFHSILTCVRFIYVAGLVGMGRLVYILLFAYASAGYVLYGPYVEDYASMINCFVTLNAAYLGSFDFPTLDKVGK
jgi:hypothetical protein